MHTKSSSRRRKPAPKGSMHAGVTGARRALFRYWPGEPFLASDLQRAIADLLFAAGHTKRVMADSNLSAMLRNPNPAPEWKSWMVDVLRLKDIGIHSPEDLLLADEDTAFQTVKRKLLGGPSPLESNWNTKGIIRLHISGGN